MRLLVVEDNAELSSLLAKGLRGAGYDADIFATAADAQAALMTTSYSAVILDLGLPDADGLLVLRDLRSRKDPVPVIVLTARGGVQDRVLGLRSGADDYLLKPFSFEELLARVEAQTRRPGQLLGNTLRLANLEFDLRLRQLTVEGRPEALSSREIAVLELLIRSAGRVVSKKHVEDHIFGLADEVASNAVEVYIHRLRRRLSESGAHVVIHTIRGVGYLISERRVDPV